MPCYHPNPAVQDKAGKIHFTQSRRGQLPHTGEFLQLPCGRCIGCRLEYSRQMGVRCMHEAKTHGENSWITLTYDDDHVPYGGSLVKSHYQNFMKELRASVYPKKVRHFGCGEYGEKMGRPHYHICLFGHDWRDSYVWRVSDGGFPLSRSDELERIWRKGSSEIGPLCYETACYTARYVTKKVNGDRLQMERYTRVLVDGRMVEVEPEFGLMSTGGRDGKGRPGGIGAGYFEQYGDELFRHDNVIVDGVRTRPPRYYDKWLERTDPDRYQAVKAARKKSAEKHAEENTGRRLLERERVKFAQIDTLTRPLE